MCCFSGVIANFGKLRDNKVDHENDIVFMCRIEEIFLLFPQRPHNGWGCILACFLYGKVYKETNSDICKKEMKKVKTKTKFLSMF